MAPTDFDREMMAIALRMAGRGLGRTRPNPSVGAVIADPATGEVIARAVTADGGRPHAETQAIARAGSRAKGATMAVTLEPCSHVGRTGPCADAIIAAGLARVVCAIEDPDPRVAGRGLDRLRAAGVEVIRGVGAAPARWVTRGHIVRVTERRPFVTLKLALDANGSVPRGAGRPTWATGPLARNRGHMLRARSDAILVGSGTVRDDDPDLTCRLPGLAERSPIRIALSRDGAIPLDSALVRTARQTPTWLIVASDASLADRTALVEAGVEAIATATVQRQIWLPSAMDALVARGVTRLLVEGGPTIWRAFADAGIYDAVDLYMAGREEAAADAALRTLLGEVSLTLADRQYLEADTLWRYRRRGASDGA